MTEWLRVTSVCRSESARTVAQAFAKRTMQSLDQGVDFTAVTLKNTAKSRLAIEPPAQRTFHFAATLANVGRRLRRLCQVAQNDAGFGERLRIACRAPAGKFCERITQTLGFLEIHYATRC